MIISTITRATAAGAAVPFVKRSNKNSKSSAGFMMRWLSILVLGGLLISNPANAQTDLNYWNLQFPSSANIVIGTNMTAYAQVYNPGLTEAGGAPPGVSCWIGYSSSNVNPSDASFTWVPATYNTQVGNNDEFQASFGSTLNAGTYYYASRFQRNGGPFYYGGIGAPWGVSNPSGVLTVNCDPAPPSGATSQSFSAGATVADLTATGSGIQWYADPTGGTALDNSTVLIDGNRYYASQTISGCESSVRLNVLVSVGALPVTIDFVNLQFPSSAAIPEGGSMTAYAQVYTAGVTEAPGAPAGIAAWIGYSSTDVDPSTGPFTWVAATYNAQANSNDEFQATFGNSLPVGVYYYASRFQRNGGPFYYGGNGGFWSVSNGSGVLTVSCAAAPTGNANQSFVTGSTVADLVATGSNILWYASSSGGSSLSPTDVLINGSHYYASQTIAGCESAGRLDVTVTILPTTIDYLNLQFPFTATIDVGGSVTVYAQVYASGATEPAGAPSGITSWIGYSSINEDPSGASFTWVPATYNTQSGNNDEFQATFGNLLSPGTYYYASRFQRNAGQFYYGGTQGAWGGGSISGVLTVNCTIAAPTGSTGQSFASGATVNDLVASGTNIQWYAAASGGSALPATDLLVNGNHYFASQTLNGCESTDRLDVTVSVTAAPSNIDFVNIQFPASANIPVGGSVTVYAQIYTLNVTEAAGAPAGINAWIGYSSNNVNPSDASFTWVPATYNAQSGDNDEFQATIGSSLPAGAYYYASRFQRNDGGFYYGGVGGFWSGSNVSGLLTVNCTPAPSGNASQTFNSGATVASLVATGNGIQWYLAAVGGTALDPATVLLNNTHYYASQTVAGCESTARLDVTVTILSDVIDYLNLQFPSTATISAGGSTTVYAQVYVAGVTEAFGQPPGILSWIGYSSSNVAPSDPSFTWIPATYNVQANNNDEFKADIGNSLPVGTYYYASRFQRNSGAFYYGGTQGAWGGSSISGVLTVNCAIPATPDVTPNGPTTFCSGGSVTLTSSAASGNQWYNNDVELTGETGQSLVTSAPGSYTVTTTDQTCVSAASSPVIVTVNSAVPIPVVSGIVNVCPYIGTGENVTYTASSPGATGFSWTLPPNVVLVNSDASSITLNFLPGFQTQANRQIRVRALSPCGNSAQRVFYLLAQAPSTPAPIVGPTNVCAIIGTAGTYSFSIPAVTAATAYVWTAQAGTTTITHPNGTGVNDITVDISFNNAFTTSYVTVQAVNDCGVSGVRSFLVSRTNPSSPSPITGPTNACPHMAPGGTPASYAVSPVAGVTYNWTVPAGSTGLTGQGSSSVSFLYPAGFSGGSISVTATNGCGTSNPRTLNVNRLNPGTPSLIDVIQVGTCPDRTYTYSVSALPANASAILWTVPAAATGFTGQGTTSITVSYPAGSISGTVTATATSNCGSSSTRSSTVRLPVCPAAPPPPAPFAKGEKTGSTITPEMQVNLFPNPAVSNASLQVITASNERINVRILDMQGRTVKTLILMSYQTINIGSDLRSGPYMVEVKQGNRVQTTRLLKF